MKHPQWGRFEPLPAAVGILLLVALPAHSASLKEMYDLAPPGPGYDKVIVLETGVTYTGGLWIGKDFNRIAGKFEGVEEDVRIDGNGAILDLQGGELTLAYTTRRLDIENCVIINGNIRFRGYEDIDTDLVPEGSVRYVTFYKPHDFGVRLSACGGGILIERNLIVDAVDTGTDFMFLSGEFNDWLPTGSSVSLSNTTPAYEIYDNWSFHSDPATNSDPLRHFNILCDYG
jgi:hypothetical protein